MVSTASASITCWKCTLTGSPSRSSSAMAKAYWICCYRAISNPAAIAEYARLAGPAIEAGGGRFLARGTPAKTYEQGMAQRTVIIEFDSAQLAISTFESLAYQVALRVMEGAAERDIRIVEGV
jgi:uncharacterized protein (DUF1330 family)